jgi:hypothetical protein
VVRRRGRRAAAVGSGWLVEAEGGSRGRGQHLECRFLWLWASGVFWVWALLCSAPLRGQFKYAWDAIPEHVIQPSNLSKHTSSFHFILSQDLHANLDKFVTVILWTKLLG